MSGSPFETGGKGIQLSRNTLIAVASIAVVIGLGNMYLNAKQLEII